MSHKAWLRHLQDRSQNEGWRIQAIPYAPAGTPATIHNTPLSLTILGAGFVVFIGGVIAGIVISPWALLASPVGLIVMLTGRFIAQWQLTRNWQSVKARCLDIEIRKAQTIQSATGYNNRITRHQVDVWVFRTLCEFTLQGQVYQATPSTPAGFSSEAALQSFLARHLKQQQCTLWVNPSNPRQCSLGKPPKL